MHEISQAISGSPVIILLMLILIVILAFITFSMSMRLSRTLKKYESFMKGKDGASLEGALRAGSSQLEEVKDQNYNLSVSTYVEQEDTRGKDDIVKANAAIREIVAREQVPRDETDNTVAEIENGGQGV